MSTPALDWLYSTQLYGIKLGLENVHKLLEAMALPQAGMKFIHVAGTNGKGSTCAFMHAILKESGISAGLFTSPHLIRFNERIRDTEREISDEELEAGLTKIRTLVADWTPHPTFFEIALALALDWFRLRGNEWVVLETGLGGRLDATNAITPEVSVLTRIGLDHRDQLGDTIAKIAGEKAGIIKQGVPVVSAPQEESALKVIERTAKSLKAPFTLVDGPLSNVKLGLMGPHQAWNASLALEGLREAGIRVPAVVLESALQNVHWAGRFHQLEEGRVVVDGAHNGDAALALAWTWKTEFPGQKATVIFGGSTGKDLVDVMWPLAEIAERWVLTPFQSPRSVPVETLSEALAEAMADAEGDIESMEARSLDDAYDVARQFPERVLVTGSLFLVGEFLSKVTTSGTYQPSGQ
ncbi:bifunctional folylpolyglutamate synthase/dihydrofolate synthase [Prosthecobacter dejongeii]|uniref:Dihydrofolate synthase/folylpolyglutamate synthase n=1 Tax=Prosthecobacter dejongeii TaxID=48465 RepID=A0A7W7YLH3_9BACT|nr:folylpolyglutamate synthase/dihydrofolate synthase family protein [Prosthecobacter dejongeii]MBB5038425.1 dihydrofolate synthase/folylpolyglutamate synthase [Prosthecobacter dejongeii]